MSIHLLHITDLHFNHDAPQEAIDAAWNIIYGSLPKMQQETPITAVVISGDFTLNGAVDEYEMAYEYLDRLSQLLAIPREKFFFCEGNHDADTKELYSTYENYYKFICRFLGEKPCRHLMTEEGEYGMLTLHTCTETSWEEYNHGVLLRDEVESASKESERYLRNIVIMHHQPEVIENGSLLSTLRGKVDLIITGHKHPQVATSYYYEGIEIFNGMAVTPHLPEIPRGYQVLQIEQGRIKKIIPYPMEL